jgi:hypothetical protein
MLTSMLTPMLIMIVGFGHSVPINWRHKSLSECSIYGSREKYREAMRPRLRSGPKRASSYGR